MTVDGLGVEFGAVRVVDDLSFSVHPGRTLAVVGESGSGKSIMSLSIMRLADMNGAKFPSGRIMFDGPDGWRDLLRADQKAMRGIRGKEIAMIFQEPMTSLNPVFTIGNQISEVLMLHEGLARAAALAECRRLLEMVRLPNAQELLRYYPNQLSGGMRQRVMVAMALACKPRLLIADEPTTALDVTIQARILRIIKELSQYRGIAVIFITHDMGVVAEMADDVVVIRKGRKVEEGPVERIFESPRHGYTKTLLAAVPKLGGMKGEPFPKRMPVMAMRDGLFVPDGRERVQDTARYDQKPLLSIDDLYVRFPIKKNFLGKVIRACNAVSNVSLDIYPGETLGLVGESGSGKSTIGAAIQRLRTPLAGEVRFNGKAQSEMSASERHVMRREVQYIFQDPFASLDPRKTVGFSIGEPIRAHGLLDNEKATDARVAELLERVGLETEHAKRHPHELSGGQRQRACIARALASKPKLIIADEPLSALDVTIQAQVINLFMDLQKEYGLAYLFISHDMAVVERVSHRVCVLYVGQIVELGSRSQVFETPSHPYTRRLLSAVPAADPSTRTERPVLADEIPSTARHDEGRPKIYGHREIATGHFVADGVDRPWTDQPKPKGGMRR